MSCATKRSLMSGKCGIRATSLFHFVTIAVGLPAGVRMPYHGVTS